MRLIEVIVVLALSLTVAPLAAEAQQAVKVPRVGFLMAGSSQGIQSYLDAFRQGLHELAMWKVRALPLSTDGRRGSTNGSPTLTGHAVSTVRGGSTGTAPNAIPSRLQRGEPVDVVVMNATALESTRKQRAHVSSAILCTARKVAQRHMPGRRQSR
jgi:hypothetical protein